MHNPTLITEEPTPCGGHTYTARRNAGPEPDGSWRWQVFAEAPAGPVGYIQSHDCPLMCGNPARLLVFDASNRPLLACGFGDGCVSGLAEAMTMLNRAAAEALPPAELSCDDQD